MVGASANTYLALFSRLGKKVNTHGKAQEGRTSRRGGRGGAGRGTVLYREPSWALLGGCSVRDAGKKREHIQQRSMDMQAENQLEGSSNEGTGWRVEKMQAQNGENMGADIRDDFEDLWVDFSREN